MKGKRERKEETEGKLTGVGGRGAASRDGKSVGALRKRMKEGQEALSVRKMNSESKVRRCA